MMGEAEKTSANLYYSSLTYVNSTVKLNTTFSIRPFATRSIPFSLLRGITFLCKKKAARPLLARIYEVVICSKVASLFASMLAIAANTRIPSVSPPTINPHWLLLIRGIQG
jgi:hypothetical protein